MKMSTLKEYKNFVLLAVILIASLVVVGVKYYVQESTVLYNPGSYTGVGMGHGGEVTVTIVVDKNSILTVEVAHENETEGIGGKEAVEDGTFAAQIMESQGGMIDGVTGATETSTAVRDALADALAQAAVQ